MPDLERYFSLKLDCEYFIQGVTLNDPREKEEKTICEPLLHPRSVRVK